MDDLTDREAGVFGESNLGRLAAFLRSVIPVDPTQLLFLTGAILLLVAPRASWRPYALIHGGTVNYWEVYGYIVFGNIVVFAAGLMALYACFWPLRNPVRKVFWAVLMTGLFGLLFQLWKFFDLTVGEPSVLDTQSRVWKIFPWVKVNTPNLPTGLFILALGLGFVAVYLSRMALRVGSLPLTLSNVNAANEEERQEWSGDKTVVFLFIGVFGFLATLSNLLAALIWKLPLTHVNTHFTDYVRTSKRAAGRRTSPRNFLVRFREAGKNRRTIVVESAGAAICSSGLFVAHRCICPYACGALCL